MQDRCNLTERMFCIKKWRNRNQFMLVFVRDQNRQRLSQDWRRVRSRDSKQNSICVQLRRESCRTDCKPMRRVKNEATKITRSTSIDRIMQVFVGENKYVEYLYIEYFYPLILSPWTSKKVRHSQSYLIYIYI